MKQFKRIPVFLLACLLVLGAAAPAARAATEPASMVETIWLEDGSRLEKEIVAHYSARSSGTTSGTAKVSYYSSDNALLWVLSVHGGFTYNGKTATATSATYSYQIYDSAWSFKGGKAYCSGNQAIAEASFSGGIFLNRSATAVLSCSPDGVLS